jgi:hypothetical protein
MVSPIFALLRDLESCALRELPKDMFSSLYALNELYVCGAGIALTSASVSKK